MMEWISVKNALPKNGDTVVIFTKSLSVYAVPYYDGFNVREGYTDGDRLNTEMTDSVLYWFRPTLPKGAIK